MNLLSILTHSTVGCVHRPAASSSHNNKTSKYRPCYMPGVSLIALERANTSIVSFEVFFCCYGVIRTLYHATINPTELLADNFLFCSLSRHLWTGNFAFIPRKLCRSKNTVLMAVCRSSSLSVCLSNRIYVAPILHHRHCS